jgi:hypothetical protein
MRAFREGQGVRGLRPRARAALGRVIRSLSTTGDTWLQAAFASSNAICWRADDVGSAKYEVTGEVEIFEGSQRQMNLLLGRTPNGFVQISFVAGFGLTSSSTTTAASEMLSGRSSAAPSPRVEDEREQRRSACACRSRRSRIELAGKSVCEVDAGDHAMSGACGVGALAGSAGAWREFSAKKL